MRFLLARATALAAILVTLVLVTAASLLAWQDSRERAVSDAHVQASSVAAVAAGTSDDGLLRRVVAQTPSGTRGQLAVHLPDGTTVGASRAAGGEVASAARQARDLDVDVGGGTAYLKPVRTLAGTTSVVEVFLPRDSLATGLLGKIVMLCVLGVLGSACTVLLADRLTRSVREALRCLGSTASAIGRGELDTRIRLTGPDDLASLAASINAIGDRVGRLLKKEREMVADVSHRLRTPLTALRLDAEAAGTGPVAERIRSAVATLEHDVDDIIRTAHPPATATDGSSDLAAVLRERMEFWTMLARDQQRDCAVRIPAHPLPVKLSKEDLAAVVDALLSNIFRYTTTGVPLAVTVVRHAGWITLVVEDGGPGIADPAVALRRGASGAGSTGLGLDIARSAVEATDGTIHLERGKLGGARIRLRFAEAGTDHEKDQPRAWRLRRSG